MSPGPPPVPARPRALTAALAMSWFGSAGLALAGAVLLVPTSPDPAAATITGSLAALFLSTAVSVVVLAIPVGRGRPAARILLSGVAGIWVGILLLFLLPALLGEHGALWALIPLGWVVVGVSLLWTPATSSWMRRSRAARHRYPDTTARPATGRHPGRPLREVTGPPARYIGQPAGPVRRLIDRIRGIARPADGTPVSTAEAVRSALLALNGPRHPFTVRDGDVPGRDLVAEYRPESIPDLRFGHNRFALTIHLRLDPHAREVRSVDAAAHDARHPFSGSRSVHYGTSWSAGASWTVTVRNGRPAIERDRRHSSDDLKKVLRDVVTSAGWVWR